MKTILTKILKYVTIFWEVNFYLFIILTMYLGGTAISGFIENGTYYVAFGNYHTEVSKTLWHINYIQNILAFYLSPLPIISAFFSEKENRSKVE